MKKALSAMTSWPGIGLAVNVSPVQLRNPQFTETVLGILSDNHFDPSRLTVEVTEGVLINNPKLATRTFMALKQHGIKIALDDFGSGFASVGSLRVFGFDRMKIDQSLTSNIDAQGAELLSATVALAKRSGSLSLLRA
jgi:EAL domain-containing protein (putative c-di-GMP-specific phosphodiesterase class I)